MAIIVDKVQKRKDIALACKELFVEQGIKDVTVSQIAKTAGVSKGSIYDYFKNKEDVVFEIVNVLMQEHNTIKQEKLALIETTKDKIKLFFNIFHDDSDRELRELYKEFISISLTQPNQEMIAFQSQCYQDYLVWFEEIIQEGINKEEILPQSIGLVKGLMASGEGIFISSASTTVINDVEQEMDEYIDTIFELIEVKK
jgi:AcrR family transcriptional regulator